MFSKEKISFHRRIITMLFLLAVVFFVPFSLLVFKTARDRMRMAITDANEAYLDQCRFIFRNYNQEVSSLCLSLYMDKAAQSILYSNEPSTQEIISRIGELRSSVLPVYPSLHSIGMYNSQQKKLYSTLSNDGDDSLEFVRDNKEEPKLSPIFRRMDLPYTDDSYIYVFSYLMYEYDMTQESPSSFVILNQDINWMLESFAKSAIAENSYTDIFILDQEYGLCGSALHIPGEVQEKFLEEYRMMRREKNGYSGSFTQKIQNVPYIVSFAALGENGTDVVMLQEEGAVFSDIDGLQKSFFLIVGVSSLFYLLLIWWITNILYRPVYSLIQHVNELNGSNVISHGANEFEQFKEIYRRSSAYLPGQTGFHNNYPLRYHLDQLLAGKKDAFLQLQKNFSRHWLAEESAKELRVLYLLPDLPGALAGENEMELNLFVLQNISTELLHESYYMEAVPSGNGIALILGRRESWGGLNRKLSELFRYVGLYFSFTFSAFYSEPVKNVQELGSAFAQTQNLAEYRILFGKRVILTWKNIGPNLENAAVDFPAWLYDDLHEAMQSGKPHKISEVLAQFQKETQKLKYENVHFCIFSLTHRMNLELRAAGVLLQSVQAAYYEKLTNLAGGFTYVDEFYEKIKAFLLSALSEIEAQSKANKNVQFLQSVCEYVDQNYSNSSLSPTDLEKRLNLTAKYILKKFHDLSGMSFHEYILKVRMTHAAELLLNHVSVSEAAESVGIDNESYFYKLFKKYYGITPKQYITQQKAE